ncbi:MAG: hypothetical protein MZV63_62425 [Marinilabiliales bacterium]|nr:hypothetical protein [Marinilabiliales bacterium]
MASIDRINQVIEAEETIGEKPDAVEADRIQGEHRVQECLVLPMAMSRC